MVLLEEMASLYTKEFSADVSCIMDGASAAGVGVRLFIRFLDAVEYPRPYSRRFLCPDNFFAYKKFIRLSFETAGAEYIVADFDRFLRWSIQRKFCPEGFFTKGELDLSIENGTIVFAFEPAVAVPDKDAEHE